MARSSPQRAARFDRSARGVFPDDPQVDSDVDDKTALADQSSDQSAGCGWLVLAFCFSFALLLAWFFLNEPFMDSLEQFQDLRHANFPTWEDWHKASEPVRKASWRIGAVMDFLQAIASLLVLGGIILVAFRKRTAGTSKVRSIGIWLLAISPAVLLVFGSMVGSADQWSRISEPPEGKDPETTLYCRLAVHSITWSAALFLASPFAWVRWEWKRSLVVFLFCFLTAVVLGAWGVKTMFLVLHHILP